MTLALYGVLATCQASNEFGRVLAAYGGVLIVGSLLWGVAFDGLPRHRRPRRSGHLPRRGRGDHVRPLAAPLAGDARSMTDPRPLGSGRRRQNRRTATGPLGAVSRPPARTPGRCRRGCGRRGSGGDVAHLCGVRWLVVLPAVDPTPVLARS
ncbi:MAG: hypothetical protein ACJ77G_11065 [Solirubrobacteraceae bacterium]